ncbi:MAG: GTPase [Christensenellales bacterium]
MKLGVVGLPNVGKSTLLTRLRKRARNVRTIRSAPSSPTWAWLPFPTSGLTFWARCTIPKDYPAVLEFVDIAGLVKGASAGEGLGNKFLSHIREVDAIVHVVRCFDDENIIHVDGSVDPVRDIETINLELELADLETVKKGSKKRKSTLRPAKKLRGRSRTSP